MILHKSNLPLAINPECELSMTPGGRVTRSMAKRLNNGEKICVTISENNRSMVGPARRLRRAISVHNWQPICVRRLINSTANVVNSSNITDSSVSGVDMTASNESIHPNKRLRRTASLDEYPDQASFKQPAKRMQQIEPIESNINVCTQSNRGRFLFGIK